MLRRLKTDRLFVRKVLSESGGKIFPPDRLFSDRSRCLIARDYFYIVELAGKGIVVIFV